MFTSTVTKMLAPLIVALGTLTAGCAEAFFTAEDAAHEIQKQFEGQSFLGRPITYKHTLEHINEVIEATKGNFPFANFHEIARSFAEMDEYQRESIAFCEKSTEDNYISWECSPQKHYSFIFRLGGDGKIQYYELTIRFPDFPIIQEKTRSIPESERSQAIFFLAAIQAYITKIVAQQHFDVVIDADRYWVTYRSMQTD